MKWLAVCLAILLATFVAGGVCAEETVPAPASGGTGEEAATSAALPAISTLPETYAELKAMYLDALERITELEASIQEALDLARGYRSDWAEERTVAETRKSQADQALEMANTLTAMIKEMKDLINKQHEIIMKLTRPSIGISAGLSLQRIPTSAGTFALQPGIALGVVVFP